MFCRSLLSSATAPLWLLVGLGTGCDGLPGQDTTGTQETDTPVEDTSPDTGPQDSLTDTDDDTGTETGTGLDTSTDTEVEEAPPPNLLLVLMDDVGADKVGSYLADFAAHGYAPDHAPATPVLDGLAGAGVRFTHAWAAPQCSPTRASLNTGEHPFRHGVGSPIPPAPELSTATHSLPEVLAPTHRAGIFGKWHLGITGEPGDPEQIVDFVVDATGSTEELPSVYRHTVNPLRHGWERFSGGMHSGICVGTGSGPCVGTYTDWIQVYGDIDLVEKAEGESQPLTLAWSEDTFATEEVVTRTLEWVEEVGTAGPWLAAVNFHAAHTPHEDFTPHGCTTSTYDAEALLEDPVMYQSMVECMDTWIGSLLDGLDGLGELDGTLVVVVGDNGTPDFAGEGPFATHGRGKATTHESGVRVPFLVADGGAWRQARRGVPSQAPLLVEEPGREEDRPVHTTDLYATFADAAGVEISSGSDSMSFLDVLLDPSATDPDRILYTETWQAEKDAVRGWAAFRDRAGLKLIVKILPDASSSGGSCIGRQLYDVVNDPLELQDLYEEPAYAADLASLEAERADLITQGAGWLDVATPCP